LTRKEVIFVSNQPPGDQQRNWFTTLPGILTSAGGFVAALTGLLVALNQVGILPVKTTPAVRATGTPASGEKTAYVVWHMKRAGDAWQLDEAEYPPADPCATGSRASPGGPAPAMLKAVRDYYAAWNDRRLDDAWALLSPDYQRKNKGAWRANHSLDQGIRLASDCVLPDLLVGMTVVFTPR
jgi:hypothetical protein